jgi:hypothetical protein
VKGVHCTNCMLVRTSTFGDREGTVYYSIMREEDMRGVLALRMRWIVGVMMGVGWVCG